MKTIKLLFNFVYALIILTLISLAILSAANIFHLPRGVRFFTVQSGSMEPAVHTGSLVVVMPQTNYQTKDVITFRNPDDTSDNPKVTTTHRIHDIKTGDSQKMFETKGDANDAPDGTLVDPKLVIGKVLFSIPLVGFPISFARTQTGLIVLIIIPATIIVYSEILNIKKEVITLIKNKKSKSSTDEQESVS